MILRHIFPLLFFIIDTGNIDGFLLPVYEYYRSKLEASSRSISHTFPEPHITLDQEYDFIIIGSGSAGAVIANRLSEISTWKILLLEAGRRVVDFNKIPLSAPAYQIGDYNWGYTMEKQDGFCLAMIDQLCSWPRGKALGGTTVLNYMIYTRGHPKEYDSWGEGWSYYDDVLPYFVKSEDCNLGPQCNSRYHGKRGYLGVSDAYKSELTDHFIAAGERLGFNKVDYNTENLIGFSRIQANQRFGRRESTATAFLDPVLNRTNLQIVEGAKVTKILIDPASKTAYGVEFTNDNGQTFSVNTRKEVILSAGVLNSPQILMLSGIGPKDHLADLGISPIIQDLPVGQKLYDHIAYPGMLYIINKAINPRWKAIDPRIALDWLAEGEGFWTSLGGFEAIALVSTKNTTTPDLELLLSGTGSLEFDFGMVSAAELRITQAFYDKYFKPLENKNVFMLMPVLLHAESFGSVRLRSKDPSDPPLCYGNYLSDSNQKDLKTLIKGIRIIQQLVQSREFHELDATLYTKPVPGCESHTFDTDSYWECAIRHLGVTLHHQITTCKMGSDSDSVVDYKLKVYGVNNLRVADTSIIPMSISAHTSAPTMMIGEKISDIIKNDYNADIKK